MKILSRLKAVSDYIPKERLKDCVVLTSDEYDFYSDDLIHFYERFLDLLWGDCLSAKEYYDEIFEKSERFFKTVNKAKKDGKIICLVKPEVKKPSNKHIFVVDMDESLLDERLKRFLPRLNSAKNMLDLFFSVDVGDTTEEVVKKLKALFSKNKELKSSYDFSVKWFWDEYKKFYDKKSDVHTLKMRGPLDFYIQFRGNELCHKYF